MYKNDKHFTIALSESRSGLIWGEAWIADAVLIPAIELFDSSHAKKHCVTQADFDKHVKGKQYDSVLGLLLMNVIQYPHLLPFAPKQGAIGKHVLSHDGVFLQAREAVLHHCAFQSASPRLVLSEN